MAVVFSLSHSVTLLAFLIFSSQESRLGKRNLEEGSHRIFQTNTLSSKSQPQQEALCIPVGTYFQKSTSNQSGRLLTLLPASSSPPVNEERASGKRRSSFLNINYDLTYLHSMRLSQSYRHGIDRCLYLAKEKLDTNQINQLISLAFLFVSCLLFLFDLVGAKRGCDFE